MPVDEAEGGALLESCDRQGDRLRAGRAEKGHDLPRADAQRTQLRSEASDRLVERSVGHPAGGTGALANQRVSLGMEPPRGGEGASQGSVHGRTIILARE